MRVLLSLYLLFGFTQPFFCQQPLQNFETKLIQSAIDARENAYCPYSKYQVGAALLTKAGEIFAGCNVENAAYGSTNCAERTAIYTAIAAKGPLELVAIVVITQDGKGYPCGACRQVINEFATPDTMVITADPDGHVLSRTKFTDLLPHAFGPNNLG